MDLSAAAEVEASLRNSSIRELKEQHASIERELASLNDQIGDLAFNNYRTYADAGRITQHCTRIFTDMNSKLKEVTDTVPALTEEIKTFFDKSRHLNGEADLVKQAIDRSHPLWDLIALPAKMDMYIRTGYYDSAYALTNYGMTLQQHEIVKNPLVKLVSDRMLLARSLLLQELLNKLSGPLDLAASIQVVNKVRQMPYLSATQLRVSLLQYRDIYLEKQILELASHPEFALKAIEVYKECMYETLVLFTAVFPENELTKKDTSVDPRWEAWPPSSPSTILGDWAVRNMNRLLHQLERAEMRAAVDISGVWTSLMSISTSLGRMGLDFRPLLLQHLKKMLMDKFKEAVREATTRFHSVRTLNVLVAGFSQNGLVNDPSLALAEGSPSQPPTPSADISSWDDLCVYGNGLLEALNALKYTASPVVISTVVATLRDSVESSLSWLAVSFGGVSESSTRSPLFARASRLLAIDLVWFVNRCLLYLFPFDGVSRLYGSGLTKQQYLSYVDLNVREMIAVADGGDQLSEVLLPLLNKRRLSALDVDGVIGRKEDEAEPPVLPDPPAPPASLHTTVLADGTEDGDDGQQKAEDESTNVQFSLLDGENKED